MTPQSTLDDPGRDTNTFYRRTLHVLSDAHVPFMVGGSHAYLQYTGIVRSTKDFDLFRRGGGHRFRRRRGRGEVAGRSRRRQRIEQRRFALHLLLLTEDLGGIPKSRRFAFVIGREHRRDERERHRHPGDTRHTPPHDRD